jgi:hypothetical protein
VSELWGEPLAKELSRGLAGVRVVPLAAIEPDLDPNVHHTNLPYAIISDRHTIAIVEGQKVAIDGPARNNLNRYALAPAAIETNRRELAEAAVWGVQAPAEQAGLVDTALSIMRFLKQGGRAWCVYVSGNANGLEGRISARGTGRWAWPAGISFQTVGDAIRMMCGDSTRDLRSLAELTDFAQREARILDAQWLWCSAHVDTKLKLKPFGEAIQAAFKRGAPERTWKLGVGEEYFLLDAATRVTVYTDDTTGTTAILEPDGTRVKITIGAYVQAFDDPKQIVARVEEITAAVKAWLASPEAAPPVRDLDYYR